MSDIGAFENQDASSALSANSMDSPSVKESNSAGVPLVFILTLSRVSAATVTVLVSTVPDTAKAGNDYIAVSQQVVSFAPGKTRQTFIVKVQGDTAIEGNEQFKLALSSPSGATLATTIGTGTILNDDSSAGSKSAFSSGATS